MLLGMGEFGVCASRDGRVWGRVLLGMGEFGGCASKDDRFQGVSAPRDE